uniref:Reverse transcriptase domain-containing protein n=1 Tax=Periophthalmus magnuspinnatus TaxID=409849 RepID=A0A3B4AKA5_9GOBI
MCDIRFNIIDFIFFICVNISLRINTVFKEFYTQLYISELSLDSNTIHTFLNKLNVPTLPTYFTRRLEEPISELEIVKAISTMQSNMSWRLDGFPSEFFKIFSKLLSPLLCSIFSESCKLGHLPQSFSKVCITLRQEKKSCLSSYFNCVISIDAEKAFDHIEPFRLCCGTRQVCPLSPMLFDLVIEPLAIALRICDGLSGIWRGGVEHMSLHDNDLLLYLSNPNLSIPTALALLNHFGTLSGYNLNINKSELFPINNKTANLRISGQILYELSYCRPYCYIL